jgi:hypothetical protein
MKAKIVVTAALVFCLFSSFAPVNPINGKWTGMLELPDQAIQPVNFSFIVNNDSLTGAASTRDDQYELRGGKVRGDSLWFFVVVPDGSEMPQSGKYYSNRDSISLNTVYVGENVHMALQRGETKMK